MILFIGYNNYESTRIQIATMKLKMIVIGLSSRPIEKGFWNIGAGGANNFGGSPVYR